METHTHTLKQARAHMAKKKEECGLSWRLAVSSLCGTKRELSILTSVFPHSQHTGILLGKGRRRVRQSPGPFLLPVGRAFHSCAHLGQAGLKCEEQRFPREREGVSVPEPQGGRSKQIKNHAHPKKEPRKAGDAGSVLLACLPLLHSSTVESLNPWLWNPPPHLVLYSCG